MSIDQNHKRHGSPIFYKLLEEMAETHDKKSHDYASNSDPAGNYHFAGQLSKLFDNPDDAGFIGRIGEKIYRLANLENGNKVVRNESIEDTERDICVITALWVADRRFRRIPIQSVSNQMSASDAAQCEIIEFAKNLDVEGIKSIINYLRRAMSDKELASKFSE